MKRKLGKDRDGEEERQKEKYEFAEGKRIEAVKEWPSSHRAERNEIL